MQTKYPNGAVLLITKHRRLQVMPHEEIDRIEDMIANSTWVNPYQAWKEN